MASNSPAQAGAKTPGSPSIARAATLSFVAAFVDTSGFIGLFGLFTAHVTGNFVLIGASLVARNRDVVAKLLAMPTFIFAIVMTTLVVKGFSSRKHLRLPVLFLLMAAILTAAMLFAGIGSPQTKADDGSSIIVGMLMVFAIGVQNALMRLELANFPPTTVMTGNVTQLVVDFMTLTSGKKAASEAEMSPERTDARKRIARMLPLVCLFTLGAALGAAGYAYFRFWCLSLPIGLTLALGYLFVQDQPSAP